MSIPIGQLIQAGTISGYSGFSGYSGAGSPITVSDEGNVVTSNLTSLDFVGVAVTATAVDGDVTVTITGAGITDVIVTGTTQTATANNRYIITNAAATTITLPASPSPGDTVYILVANALVTNVVARNGENIMGLAEDMTLNTQYLSLGLDYVNSTLGWRII